MPTDFQPGTGASPNLEAHPLLREQPGQSPQGAAPRIVQGPKPQVLEPPHPILEAAGYRDGGIGRFNQKVRAVVTAHRNAYGSDPSPGLVLDVVRSDVPEHQYADLFTVPKSTAVARAHGALIRQGIDPDAPESELRKFDPKHQLIQALNGASSRDEFNQVVNEYADTLHGLIDHGDQQVLRAYTAAQARGISGQIGDTRIGAVKAESFVPQPGSLLGKLERVTGDTVRAASQIETGLVLGPPLLAVAEGKGIAKSVKDRSAHPFLATNAHLAKQVVTGAAADVTHPEENAGNLLLDVFGLASAGFGTATRIGAAGRALARGEGAAVAGRALLTKTATGTAELGPGANVPLSSNPLAATIQKVVFNHRLKGLSLDESAGPVPTGAAPSLVAEKAQQLADAISDPFRRNFSMENKIGRQLRAADRVERAARMAMLEPLEKATGSAQRTSLVIRRLTPRGWRGLNVGEQKAIQVLTTDDPTPLETWQQFHERMIEQGVGDAAAHRAHLAALQQARKVIAKPSPKFQAALDAVREVMAQQTQLRIAKLGLTPESAESRVARLGTVLRGEPDIAAMSDTELRARLTDIDSRYEKLVDGLMPAKPGDYKAVTAIQNAANAKAARRGIGPVYSTVRQQARAVAEKRLVQMLETNADDPLVARFLTELSEADGIRRELTARADKAIGLEEGREVAEPREPAPGRAYLLYQSLAKRRRAPKTFFRPQPGPFGIPHPDGIPEVSHYFSGDVIRAGDFRIDATRLASETYARTVSAATKLEAWKRLHDHYATDVPRTPDDIPIRSADKIDDQLRALIQKVDNGQVLTAEDVRDLPEHLADDLTRYLMPHPDEAVSKDGDWKWVDPRYVASEPRSSVPTPLVRFFSNVNEPLRDLWLFVRPGYVINIIGSAQMAAIDQGVFVIPNLVRALRADAKTGRWLDALAGEGRMLSYAPNVGFATRISHSMASFWNRFTDLYFRRAAVIHHLRKLGYRTEEQLAGLRDAYLRGDEQAVKDATEASQRGKKAMVEMDNLTPIEKNALRHFIFVYPWVSRSAVWSLKTIVDHPMQAAILAEIAHSEHDEIDPVLEHLPGWARDLGYTPVSFNSAGMPLVINPSSVNTFSTLGEIAGVLHGDQVFTDLLGPGADLVVRLATERDRFGRAYKHPYIDPALETLTGLPQVTAFKRAGQKEPPEKPLDVTNPEALVEREHADVHRPIFVPGGFWSTYGPLIASGLAPRALDPRAVEARWWQGQPWEQRHKHEAQLVQKMAGVQGEFIGQKVPADVRDALTLTSARTEAYHQFSQGKGRTPTLVEKTQLDIATLEQAARINGKQAEKLRGELKKVAPDALDTFRTGILDRFAGGKELSEWHRKVALVAKVGNPQQLDADVQSLIASGVLPKTYKDVAKASKKALLEYGRAYLAYDAKVRDYARREKAARAKGEPTTQLMADLRLFQDEQDKPVTIDGHTFPSLPRIAAGQLTTEQLAAHLADNYGRSLHELSAVDKSLMGIQSSAANTKAWSLFDSTLRRWRQEEPGRGFSPHDPYYAKILAKRVDDYYKLGGAFVDEVKLSLEPRWQMLQQTNLYTESAHKSDWDAIFKVARREWDYLANPDYSKSGIRQGWRDWVKSTLIPDIKKQDAGFWREVQPILNANPGFFDSLIERG